MTDIATMTLPQLRQEHDGRSQKLDAAFVKAKTDDPQVLDLSKVTEYEGTNDEKHAAMLAEMKFINDLGAEIEKKRELIDVSKGAAAARKLHDPQGMVHVADDAKSREQIKDRKSIGQLFVESEAYKNRIDGAPGPAIEIDLEKEYGRGVTLKTVFDTATSWAVESIRLPRIEAPYDRPRRVADLMSSARVSGNAVTYMEETTTTEAAAETAESAAKPEAALAFTERTEAIRKIAVSLPVTSEALEDIPFIEDYINGRLRVFLEKREDLQLLKGDGTAPNISGIQDRSIQTQAKGADPTPDAIYKAMTKIRLYFAEPDGFVVHPNDWQQIALLRTSDDNYFWGGPVNAAPERIWGIPVVITAAETEGTGLVGAFQLGAQVLRRSMVTFQVGYINDQFTKNQRTIIAEERLGLAVYQPNLFCTVTGI